LSVEVSRTFGSFPHNNNCDASFVGILRNNPDCHYEKHFASLGLESGKSEIVD